MAFSSITRLALLGADADTVQLVRAIGRSRRLQLVGYCELDTAPDGVPPLPLSMLVGARAFDTWEALLDQQTIDAVIVARARHDDQRTEQLRKLIQVGVPLLVSHPVLGSMLVYYELDMIRRETGCRMLPYMPARSHPAIQRIVELASHGAESLFGKIEQVTFERSVEQPTKDEIVRQFARDVDLIRAIAGEVTRLGAMAGDGEGYSGLSVQMSGPMGAVARWSVHPGPPSQSHLVVRTTRAKAIVNLGPSEPWTLETTIDGATDSRAYAAWDPADSILSRLEALLDAPSTDPPNWVDAARSVELAETIDRSLAKGRTIELYYEDYTEEGTFKGTMTSVGCGLLLVALFLLGAVGIGEQLGLPYVKGWPYLLLGAFGLFLLLQFLLVVSRKGPDTSPRAAESPPDMPSPR